MSMHFADFFVASNTISSDLLTSKINLDRPRRLTSTSPFSKGSYVIGSGDKLELTTDIVNSGEDAFNAMLYLQIPRDINYISANSSNAQVSILCSPPEGVNNRTLRCEVGNPLPAKTKVRVYAAVTHPDSQLNSDMAPEAEAIHIGY